MGAVNYMGFIIKSFMDIFAPNKGNVKRRKGILDDDLLESQSPKAIRFVGDVRKNEDVTRVVNATFQHFGRIDILVNAAAGNFLVPAEDLSPNGFKEVVWRPLYATLHYSATWYQIHVPAAKATIDAMARSLALEWGTDYDIRVNGIAPGPINDTPGLSKLDPHEMKSIQSGAPTHQFILGEKWDIAMAALYLASDAGNL
ncbi:hypothetical protein MKW98_001124 [Papaver atlanticum]|uniref:2,4-dienoyl-CoA reductase [(3E)-enoyl-CoA-producing] n=1 Tax=Papaver atlanticum TaxID=357466 RepID=A0AAD4STW2_9MAGN|nr:hypothetical protein MKW98_001124 [Papaver atlanticum]